MKQIIPNFWFNRNAEEAVQFYTHLFRDSGVGRVDRYTESGAEVSGMPVGSVLSVEFKLRGQDFVAINGGDYFKFNPSISMSVSCESQSEMDRFWKQLSEGGKVLMELGAYPFSERYGFLQDRFGVPWQLNLNGQKQKIVPSLIFVDQMFGRAEEAMKEYVSIFKDAKVMVSEAYKKGEVAREGALKYGVFTLKGQEFIAMDGAGEHGISFNGAISFLVDCENQDEIDYFWSQFTKGGQEMPCGWVADRFGVHWQVFANSLGRYFIDPDPVKAERALKAMYAMKKIDIETIRRAHGGDV